MIMLRYKCYNFFQLLAQASFCKRTKQGKSNGEPGYIMASLLEAGIAVVSLRSQRARGTERQLPERKQQKQQQ